MPESESPPHTRLLQELDRLHRESIFPVLFERLSFDMVASFECGIARQNGVVLLKSTTFWMSHDRDPAGQMKFVYDDDFGRRAGSMLSSDNLTTVYKPGDFDVAIVGFALSQEHANQAVAAHTVAGGLTGEIVEAGPRSANRDRRRVRR